MLLLSDLIPAAEQQVQFEFQSVVALAVAAVGTSGHYSGGCPSQVCKDSATQSGVHEFESRTVRHFKSSLHPYVLTVGIQFYRHHYGDACMSNGRRTLGVRDSVTPATGEG
jgi:hypothetical protein